MDFFRLENHKIALYCKNENYDKKDIWNCLTSHRRGN